MKLIEDIKNVLTKVPRRSVNYLLFCLSGVLIFVFAGIAPAYWNNVYHNEKIADARRRIEESGTLQPVFRSLQSIPMSVSSTLTVPRRVAMPRNNIEQVDALFRDLAGPFGVKVVSTVPDLVSADDPHELVVTVALKGDFENFRNVLRKIGELPSLVQIEEYSIQRTGNSKALDISIRLSLAVN